MKQKIYLTIILVLTVFTFMACDSLWKHTYDRPVTISLTIPQELIRSVTSSDESFGAMRSVQGGSAILSNVKNVDPTITARVSIHNAQDNAILTEKTIPLGDSLDDTVTFEGLYIVGKTVYVQIELSQLGYVARIEKSNPLTVIEGLNKIEFAFDDAEIATYYINYNLDDGENFENAPTSYTMVTPTMLLGTPVKIGYLFDGWYANEKFEGDAITEIAQGSIGDITLYAKWTEMVSFYVSSSGDDTLGNGTSAKPFASVQKAVDTILEKNDGVSIYGIIISGTIIDEGENVDAGIDGIDNGMVEIESDIPLNIILLGLGATPEEKGSIDAGARFTVNADNSVRIDEEGKRKRVLYISGENVHVTLGDNITLTGGSVDYGVSGVYVIDASLKMQGNASIRGNIVLAESHAYGGGVNVSGGSLTMTDSASISGNFLSSTSANATGGGVYAFDGTVTMTGDASISDNTTSTSLGTSSGGGVYVSKGSLTMEGSASIRDNTVSSSSSSSGGGVYVSRGGTLNLSGNPKITDNEAGPKDSETTNNVQYDYTSESSRGFVNVVGELNEDAEIGITPHDTAGQGSIIVYGVAPYKITSDDVKKFTLDDSSLGFGLQESGNNIVATYSKIAKVYLNGETGDDTKSGVDAGDNAVKTFGVALSLLEDTANAVIVISGTVTVSSSDGNAYDETWDGKAGGRTHSVTIERRSDSGHEFPDALIVVRDKTGLTLQNITIDGMGNVNGLGGAVIATDTLIKVDSGATLTLNSGTILQNNNNVHNGDDPNSKAQSGGAINISGGTVEFPLNTTAQIKSNQAQHGSAIICIDSGTLTMNDGIIGGESADKNIATSNAAVYVDSGTFTMSGGEIKNNETQVNTGGGVYVYTDGDFTMSGDAKISKNSTENNGGGVSVRGGTFTMNGGTIDDNVAINAGGIYINGGTVTLGGIDASNENVVISNHTVTGNGGGIYVAGGTLTMDYASARIEGNSATSGGGVYLNTGTFNLSAGTITSNIRGATGAVGGGGIYIDPIDNGQVLNLSGNPNVSGNTVGDTNVEDNINFANTELESPVKITAELTSGADLGLSPSSKNSGDMLVQNTSSHNFDASYFTADGDAFEYEKYGDHLRISPLITMVYINSGTFKMGSLDGEAEATDNEKPEHDVKLNSFYLGSTEVTEAQWEAVMGSWPGTDPEDSINSNGASYPARFISWYDAVEFCNALTRAELTEDDVVYTITKTDETNQDTWTVAVDVTKSGYRLPTEAEWEYAAGGAQATPTIYAGTDDENSLASYAVFSTSNPSEVKGKLPVSGEYALYDMSGNVWEWCYDWFDQTYYDASTNPDNYDNPTGPASSSNSNRVVRGGSWHYISSIVRVAKRLSNLPSERDYDFGFRVARSAN